MHIPNKNNGQRCLYQLQQAAITHITRFYKISARSMLIYYFLSTMVLASLLFFTVIMSMVPGELETALESDLYDKYKKCCVSLRIA